MVLLWSWSPCLVAKLSPRERGSWIIDLCGGSRTPMFCCDAGLYIDDEVFLWLSDDDNNLTSSFPSLFCFTFSNCLNLSWRRAMEEFTMVGSSSCLPIWYWYWVLKIQSWVFSVEGKGSIFWWVWHIVVWKWYIIQGNECYRRSSFLAVEHYFFSIWGLLIDSGWWQQRLTINWSYSIGVGRSS